MMYKFFRLFPFICLIIFFGWSFLKKHDFSEKKRFSVGIMTTASHPALDAVLSGFVETVKAETNDDVVFTIANGQGQIPNIHAIAQRFSTRSFDLIFAIATPVVQSIIVLEHDTPLIFAAVTNPAILHLDSAKNVTGVTDAIDIESQIEAVCALLPNLKKVGIIFNPAETSAVVQIESMKTAFAKKEIETFAVGITSVADIGAAIDPVLRRVDALIAPLDTMVAIGASQIAEIAQQKNKPFIASDNLLVAKGALMARGVDYKTVGHLGGLQAAQILLQNKKPDEIPIAQADCSKIYINKERFAQFGLTLPASLEPFVTWVS
jgi:putative tryptophan/tyrosine transport system substrate-binding protein